jgi:hypothetical protein
MIRVLHMLEAEADFQTQRCARQLAEGLGGEFSVASRRIGRGGNWRNLAASVIGIRRAGDLTWSTPVNRGDLATRWGPNARLVIPVPSPCRRDAAGSS